MPSTLYDVDHYINSKLQRDTVQVQTELLWAQRNNKEKKGGHGVLQLPTERPFFERVFHSNKELQLLLTTWLYKSWMQNQTSSAKRKWRKSSPFSFSSTFSSTSISSTMATVTQPDPNIWLADLGASHHISCNMGNYTTFERIDKPYKIQQLQGEILVTHWGTIQLVTQSATRPRHLLLSQVLYIPGMNFNILSLQKIVAPNYIPVFGEIHQKCIIKKTL